MKTFRSNVKRSKYRAKKTEIDGITFDSIKEGKRYEQLKIKELIGEITDLQLQVPFELTPSIKLKTPRRMKTKKGNPVRWQRTESASEYIADFVYKQNGETVVEDVKGYKTPDYVLKRKMMLYRYGIEIQEV